MSWQRSVNGGASPRIWGAKKLILGWQNV